jgi:Glu-tRNAGln amidotransferase C subunit.
MLEFVNNLNEVDVSNVEAIASTVKVELLLEKILPFQAKRYLMQF